MLKTRTSLTPDVQLPTPDLRAEAIPRVVSGRARHALVETMDRVESFFRDVAYKVEGFHDREVLGIDNAGSKTSRHRTAHVLLDAKGTPFEEEQLARRIRVDQHTGRETIHWNLDNPLDAHLVRLVNEVSAYRKHTSALLHQGAGEGAFLTAEKELSDFFEQKRNNLARTPEHRSAYDFLCGLGTAAEEEELSRRITRDKATGAETISFNPEDPLDRHLMRLVAAVCDYRERVSSARQNADHAGVLKAGEDLGSFFEQQRAAFRLKEELR